MIYLWKSSVWLIISLALSSCGVQKTGQKEGVVRIVTVDLNDSARMVKVGIMPPFKIYYSDSLVVEEIYHNRYHRDSSGQHVRENFIHHYTFVDLKTLSYYDYTAFSDTAILIRKFNKENNHIPGFNFFNDLQTNLTRPVEPLPDTILNGILHHRHRAWEIMGETKNPVEFATIMYLRCDSQGIPFDFRASLSFPLNCPVVRNDDVRMKPEQPALSTRIEILPDKLTPDQRKAFAVWEKFAKENPVK